MLSASTNPTLRQAAALLAAQKPSEIDLEALEASESEGLLAQLVAQRARLQSFAEMAAELGDVKAAVAVERTVQGNLELVAKLLGQLVQRHEVRSTSILVSHDYIELRSVLVKALWNSDHADEDYDPAFLTELKQVVERLQPWSEAPTSSGS